MNAKHNHQDADMKSPVAKRSIVIDGHKTSVSLEEAFWNGLKDISQATGLRLTELVSEIDRTRRRGNLSSAIRLFVLDHYMARASAANGKTPSRLDGVTLPPS